jgi:hypothetical protein
LVVGQAIFFGKSEGILLGYWSGDAPEAHKLRPDSVGTDRSNNGEQEGRAIKKGIKTPPQAGDILIANFKIM